jgi:hypothetical protein
MKKIYVSHSTGFDYQKELYAPLKRIEGFEFIFPHEKSLETGNSQNVMKECSLILAEVSMPSHGVGIELGWASMFNVPVVYIHKKGAKLSSSLRTISSDFVEYEGVADILEKVRDFLNSQKDYEQN